MADKKKNNQKFFFLVVYTPQLPESNKNKLIKFNKMDLFHHLVLAKQIYIYINFKTSEKLPIRCHYMQVRI